MTIGQLNSTMGRIEGFIRSNFLFGEDVSRISPGRDLLEILDSLGLIQFVEFLEKEFSICIDDEDVTRANVGTLEDVTRFVDKQLAK